MDHDFSAGIVQECLTREAAQPPTISQPPPEAIGGSHSRETRHARLYGSNRKAFWFHHEAMGRDVVIEKSKAQLEGSF